MTVLEPLPGTYGRADWVDYSNYWREADAEWLQDRIVLRTPNATSRDALNQSPGTLVYNEALDQVELCSKASVGATKVYKTLTPLPTTLTTAEAGGKTTISHTGAGGQGLVFGPTALEVSDDFVVLNGVLTVNTTGVSIRAVGTKTAKLTTSATELVSDSPLSAPGITITSPGTISAAGRAATVGALSASSAAVGGVLTAGAGSSISGFTFKSGYIEHTTNGGFQSTNGYFHGQSDSAVMRYRDPNTLANGSSYLQVTLNDCISVGTYFWMHSTLLIRGGKAINYYDAAGNFQGYISPSFYSSGSPNAANFPDGTIWVQ